MRQLRHPSCSLIFRARMSSTQKTWCGETTPSQGALHTFCHPPGLTIWPFPFWTDATSQSSVSKAGSIGSIQNSSDDAPSVCLYSFQLEKYFSILWVEQEKISYHQCWNIFSIPQYFPKDPKPFKDRFHNFKKLLFISTLLHSFPESMNTDWLRYLNDEIVKVNERKYESDGRTASKMISPYD